MNVNLTSRQIREALTAITGKKPEHKACYKSMVDFVKNASVEGDKVRVSTLHMDVIGLGCCMEDQLNLISATKDLLNESLKETQDMYNQVLALRDVTFPLMLKQVQQVRDIRMSIVSEMAASLNALREVRTFFFEKDYQIEMERMERFVKLCQEIKKLKEDGTFDAICDSAIRLAIKEESK